MADATTKTYDAVLVPRALVPGATETDRLHWIKATFGPLLGAPRVYGRIVGADLLCTASGDGTPGAPGHRYHANDHPKAGQERYAWEPAPGGAPYVLGTREKDDA